MAVTNYFWDSESDNVLMESDDAGDTTAVYTHEPGKYGKLISQHRDGETTFYHFDGQGSTRVLTDEHENVTDTFTYSAFGVPVARAGLTLTPFRFMGSLGYHTDDETDNVYVRARMYAAQLGRWFSLDPLGFVDGANMYLYVGSSPTNQSDPSGNWPLCGVCTAPPPAPPPAKLCRVGIIWIFSTSSGGKCVGRLPLWCCPSCSLTYYWLCNKGKYKLLPIASTSGCP